MQVPTERTELDFIEKQKTICRIYGAEYSAAPFNKLIGVALESFNSSMIPVNGLRHPSESDQSVNWYLWAGEYSEANDFFQPVHIRHLLEICPKAIGYLGLAPGWRFLFDNHYEDVWYDPSLLSI